MIPPLLIVNCRRLGLVCLFITCAYLAYLWPWLASYNDSGEKRYSVLALNSLNAEAAMEADQSRLGLLLVVGKQQTYFTPLLERRIESVMKPFPRNEFRIVWNGGFEEVLSKLLEFHNQRVLLVGEVATLQGVPQIKLPNGGLHPLPALQAAGILSGNDVAVFSPKPVWHNYGGWSYLCDSLSMLTQINGSSSGLPPGDLYEVTQSLLVSNRAHLPLDYVCELYGLVRASVNSYEKSELPLMVASAFERVEGPVALVYTQPAIITGAIWRMNLIVLIALFGGGVLGVSAILMHRLRNIRTEGILDILAFPDRYTLQMNAEWFGQLFFLVVVWGGGAMLFFFFAPREPLSENDLFICYLGWLVLAAVFGIALRLWWLSLYIFIARFIITRRKQR